MALAHRHKRYGVGMIHLKLRQAGLLVNYKRVERLYQEAKLQVRRRKRKKVPVGERQPLLRPKPANEVWSMDFVFDRTAEGRVLKCLTIVDDATHESVAIEVERAISGQASRRSWIALRSARPAEGDPHRQRQGVLRQGDGDLGARAWRALRLIEPGKPNQNAYIESFNGRLRDECLNEHWFPSLLHARTEIETWRREYNEERPKKALGGMTPAAYAKQLAMKAVQSTPDSKSDRYSRRGDVDPADHQFLRDRPAPRPGIAAAGHRQAPGRGGRSIAHR